MDGCKKIHPSTKHSAVPKLSSSDLQSRSCYSKDVGKVNKNDQNAHQMDSKMQSPKNFMSPTVSTASKAASSKKVLGERNESSGAIISGSRVHKSPVSNPRATYGSFNDLNHPSLLTPKVSELDQEESISAADPSSQPYDPLTNYLSPRPKFLRYRPNRRLEFLLSRESGREKEENPQESIEEEESNQSDADGLSSSSSPEVSLEQEDRSSLRKDCMGSRPSTDEESNHNDDSEDMEDFEVDDRHWHFNKVFKSLLLLRILILSTMCISSMNSPTPPPYIETLQEVKEGYQKIQEYLFQDIMVNIATASNFSYQKREIYQGITNRNETVTAEGIQEEEMLFSIGMKKTGETIDTPIQLLDLQNRENMEVSDNNLGQAGENFYEVEKLGLQQLEKETHTMPDSQTQFMSHWVGNQSAKVEQERDEVVTEALGTLKHEIDLWRESIIKWMDEVENISGRTSQMPELLDRDNKENSQESQTQMILGAKAAADTTSDIHNTYGTEADLEEEDLIKPTKSQFIARAAIGVSVIAISVVFGLLRFKNRRAVKGSQLRVQSSSESTAVETRSSEISPSESMANGDSPNLSLSVHSEDKAFKELHQSGVPKVELLGEFMVGEISSSIKSCGPKSKKVEGEESNFSVSQDKRSRRKIPSSVNYRHLSLSESSAAEFPSYGSFTAQENIVKNEEGNDGEEVKKMSRTPVRRSNRIRNRAIISP